MQFDSYHIVLLKRGPKAADFDEEELKALQSAHLDHIDYLRRTQGLLVAGPFAVSAMYPMRGAILFPGERRMEEITALIGDDPSVRAGRMSFEVLKWYVPAGSIRWPEAEPSTTDEGDPQ